MNGLAPRIVPYCGSPPSPDALLGRWNLDPVLIGGLLLLLALYLIGRRRLPPAQRRGLGAFVAGWAVGAAALVSPLCPLSVSLFSARVGQHMLLILVAAPLVALGRPGAVLRAAFGRASPARGAPLSAAALFLALLWLWHAPGPYAATFSSAALYWVMHLSLFFSALWLWSELLGAPASAAQLGAAALTMMQMGFLGALITLAPRPLYGPHLLTTFAWGLDPLQDQQLGGAIMWIPGAVVFLAVALALGARLISPAPAGKPVAAAQ